MIATNIALTLARQGKNIFLAEMDFRVPCFGLIFGQDPPCWLNDFVDGNAPIEETPIDFTSEFGTTGKLYVGMANPSYGSIRGMLAKEVRWDKKLLKRLLSTKETLVDDTEIDYLLMDVGHEVHYISVNVVAASDYSIIVSTPGLLELEYTKRIVEELYRPLIKKGGLILNKSARPLYLEPGAIPVTIPQGAECIQELQAHGYKMVEAIPFYNDLAATGPRVFLGPEHSGHPFMGYVKKVAEIIDGAFDPSQRFAPPVNLPDGSKVAAD